MASIPSFIFGGNTKYKTQEELEAAREQVRAMLGDIGHSGLTGWGSALADLGKGIGARIDQGRIDEGQAELLERQGPFSQTLAEIGAGYGGGGGGAGSDVLAGGGAQDAFFQNPGGGVDAGGYLRYANQGATRNKPLAPKLEQALSYLGDLGVTAEVFSGGQESSGPNRTGSHRHDEGNAGDIRFYKDGRQLSWSNKEDLPLFQEIVRQGKARGITGFGAGPGYMGEGTMHVGFGTPAVWGAGGSSRNAPGWLRDAYSGSGGDQLAGGGGSNNQAGGAGTDAMTANRDAIASIESAGSGDYAAVGRPDKKLGRPLGRYQIMEKNIGPWSKKHLGREVTPQEFLANPAIQDAIFDGEFGGYVQKYGREGAAQAWLGGPGAVGKDDRADALGTTVGEYGKRFVANLGGGGGSNALAGGGAGDSFLQARPVPINQAGLRTPQGQEFLGRMSNPAPMGGQPPPMVPTTNGPMPLPAPPPQAAPAPAPVPAPPAPAPTPPAPPAPRPQVDPFTQMILGDKAAQFKPGNYIPPAPVGKQVFPAAPPAPGTPAAAGFGVPPVVGGGGADQLAGKGTFPPAPAPPQAPPAGGGDKIAKLQFILASPYASKEQKLMAGSMIQREYALEDERRKAAAAANDPLTQLQLRKAELEVKKLEGGGGGPFSGESVEAQALNGMVANGTLTVQQAYDLAAGKTITNPADGSIIFMTPQGLVGGPPGQPPQLIQPTTPPAAAPQPAATPTPAPAPAGSPQPAPQAPAPQQPSAQPGRQLTPGKPGKMATEAETRARALYAVASPEMKTVETMFPALSDVNDQVISKLPWGTSNWATSEEYQRGKNALMTIIQSYMYVTSGASAPDAEVERNAISLMPQLGEKPGTIKDKLARIQNYVRAIKMAGGQAEETAPAGGGGNTDYKTIYGLE